MRSVLPWLASLAMAIAIGWLVEEQTELQRRIDVLEARAQSGVPKVGSSAASDGSDSSSEPLTAPETRRELGEMRAAIQSLQTELAASQQVIVAPPSTVFVASAYNKTLQGTAVAQVGIDTWCVLRAYGVDITDSCLFRCKLCLSRTRPCSPSSAAPTHAGTSSSSASC